MNILYPAYLVLKYFSSGFNPGKCILDHAQAYATLQPSQMQRRLLRWHQLAISLKTRFVASASSSSKPHATQTILSSLWPAANLDSREANINELSITPSLSIPVQHRTMITCSSQLARPNFSTWLLGLLMCLHLASTPLLAQENPTNVYEDQLGDIFNRQTFEPYVLGDPANPFDFPQETLDAIDLTRLTVAFEPEGKEARYPADWLLANAYDRETTRAPGWTTTGISTWDATGEAPKSKSGGPARLARRNQAFRLRQTERRRGGGWRAIRCSRPFRLYPGNELRSSFRSPVRGQSDQPRLYRARPSGAY